MIHGSEYAPTKVVGYVTERGGFYTSIEDIPKVQRWTQASSFLTHTLRRADNSPSRTPMTSG